jgi:hypothetical protein
MKLFKDIRVVALIVLLLVSAYFVFSSFISRKSGVVVSSVEKDSSCSLNVNDVITSVSVYEIRNVEDFKEAERTIRAGDYIEMMVNGGPGGCKAVRDGYFGITVADVQSKRLNFGVDIQGGLITTFTSEKMDDIDKVKDIINKRITILNVPETRSYVENSTIKIATPFGERINKLIVPGYLEAVIRYEIKTENNTGKIKLGNNSYSFDLDNYNVIVNSSTYSVNQSFSLEDIRFVIVNATNTSITVEAGLFNNDDITNVLTSFSYVTYNSNSRSYEFSTPVEVSKSVSDRLSKITKGMKTVFVGARVVLDGSLVFYLDKQIISTLSIPFEIVSKELNTISITGSRNTLSDATEQHKKITMVLESGKLSYGLHEVGIEQFKGWVSGGTLWLVFITLVVTLAISVAIGYLINRRISTGIYGVVLMTSVLFCTLGLAAITQSFYTRGWIIDFTSIIGLLVFSWINTIQMFLISEQLVKKKDFNLKLKYKKLFGITTLLNIIVLLSSFILLFTPIKGAGLSLLSCTIVGLLLTTPIYEKIVQKAS